MELGYLAADPIQFTDRVPALVCRCGQLDNRLGWHVARALRRRPCGRGAILGPPSRKSQRSDVRLVGVAPALLRETLLSLPGPA